MSEGWIIDANIDYKKNCLRLWVFDNRMHGYFFEYYPSIFVHSNVWHLEKLRSIILEHPLVIGAQISLKKLNFYHKRKSRVLEVFIRPADFKKVCTDLKELPHVQIFHCDFGPISQFFFRGDVFPFGRIRFNGSNGIITDLKNIDDRMFIEYETPHLSKIYLTIKPRKTGHIIKFSDPIDSVTLIYNDEKVVIDYFDEVDILKSLEREIQYFDPDIIVTDNGDSFLFPYLFQRANYHQVKLSFSRDNSALWIPESEGKSYWAYNRVLYRVPPVYLRGRLHFDKHTCYFYSDSGYEGVIEGSRISGLPPQKLARASIGTINAATQYITAFKQDILIPERKLHFQDFRSVYDIYLLDRGGLIFQPQPGIYENIAELDFSSMYPMIMINNNISPETLCTTEKCPYNHQYCASVPELSYRFCKKEIGIVPMALKPIIDKRLAYKKLMPYSDVPQKYNRIQTTLKGVLVSCFGYLGFKNARFGRYEAHAAVTAFARETLLKTKEIAETMGFEIIHGIVDSVWIKPKDEFVLEKVLDFAKRVSEETKIPMDYNGRYRWFVIPSSMTVDELAPINHYWGVFENGRVKVRGLATRRHDSCNYIERFQNEVIQFMSKANSMPEFMDRVRKSRDILNLYIRNLRRRKVPIEDLIITHRLSRNLDDYKVFSRGLIAAKKLLLYGKKLNPGQKVKYVIVNNSAKYPIDRVTPIELLDDFTVYDPEPYVKMLEKALDGLFPSYVRNMVWSDTKQTSLLTFI